MSGEVGDKLPCWLRPSLHFLSQQVWLSTFLITEEHQIVVNFITNQLEKLKLKDFSVSETKTVRAGQLLHLRTDIKK